ncbi:hypothetical protein D1013_04295 [Euzebyella marina]|uniref:Lipopolysaccharide biosynthesis protein n=2 Tax=Euzebyella marina TaxID=1761453 RepID=A0A3G2L394_9FLAO|nr:hypothetical protein D1013_04295 [Euzebyella marina]
MFQNGLASVFQKGVRVLEQLFLVPFFISSWGAAYYGEWLTLTIVPTVIAFSDFGFGSAAANSFVLKYAANKKQEAADINKTGIYVISLTILLALLLSFLVLYLLNYFDVFSKSLIDSQEAIIAVSILIFTQLLSFYRQLIEAYYRAAERASLSINLVSFKALANVLAGLLVLLLGYGIVEFALSQLMVMIIFIIGYWLKGQSVIGLFKSHKGRRDNLILKDITTKGLSYLMLPLWQIIYFQGSTFVVRIVLGAESVAVFNTVRTLSRSFNQILYLVEPTVFPELINQIGKNAWGVAQRIFRVAIISVFGLSVIGFIFLSLFGLWFYKVWTNNELEVPSAMWYIFVSGMLLNALWYTAEMVFRAVNKPRKMGLYGLTGAIISVGTIYVMAEKIGLVGAAIGTITLDIILLFLVLPEACKLMRMNIYDLFSGGLGDLRNFIFRIKKSLLT